jgi:hypothetical protein
MKNIYIKCDYSGKIIAASEESFFQSVLIQTPLTTNELMCRIYEKGTLKHSLESLRQEKLEILEKDFQKSKKISIVNGKTLEISHDCPSRKFFLKILEDVKRLDENLEVSHIFTQKSSGLGFKVSPYIANYILLKDFTANLDNRIVQVREYNKAIIYDNANEELNMASSIDELNLISWLFLKKDGVVVNVDERVKAIMEGDNQDLIEAVSRVTDENGDLHFIRPIKELKK